MSFVLEKTRASRTQSPRGLNVTQRCENRPGTQVSTPIGHSGSHDLWGHRANVRPVPPFFCLLPCNAEGRSLASPAHICSFYAPSTGEGCPALSIHLFERSTPLLSSQRRRVEVQLTLSTQITFMEESCSFQLISPRKPPRNPSSTNLQAATRYPAGELQTATELHSPTELQRQEPQNQRDDFTELRTAQQPFFLFHGRVT